MGYGPPSPIVAVPNITAHPSTASVPITVLLYDGLLLCGFNVATKGLTVCDVKARILQQLWFARYQLISCVTRSHSTDVHKIIS